jgi:hypothetical protein
LVHFQLTTRRYVPEDRTIHNHRCRGLKSHRVCFLYEYFCILTSCSCKFCQHWCGIIIFYYWIKIYSH